LYSHTAGVGQSSQTKVQKYYMVFEHHKLLTPTCLHNHEAANFVIAQ